MLQLVSLHHFTLTIVMCTDMAVGNQLLGPGWIFSRLCVSNALVGHVLAFFGEADDRIQPWRICISTDVYDGPLQHSIPLFEPCILCTSSGVYDCILVGP